VARYAISVDWMTFVVPVLPADGAGEGEYLSETIERTLVFAFGKNTAYALFSTLEPLGYGRAPYKFGFQDHDKGITVWAGGAAPHMCVEFSGKGCQYLSDNLLMWPILDALAERLSRLDIAIDLEQGVAPEEFLKLMKLGRQQSNARFNSPSGSTVYVGSPHSERYVRVYRYASPHPRSHLLRIETVFRRAVAKQAGKQLVFGGLETVARAGALIFGFDHLIDWKAGVTPADLSVARPERNMGKTQRWLITQAAPAFRRLIKEGVIADPVAWLDAYFLTEPETREDLG